MNSMLSPVRRVALSAVLMSVALVGLAQPSRAQRGQRGRGDATAEADLQRAIALTREGKFTEAIQLFLAARGQVANDYVLSFNLALCYVATAQHPRAIELLTELRSSGRLTGQVENLLAQALFGNRQPEAALQAFDRAARQTPKDEKLHLLVAEAAMSAGYHREALQIVELGLKRLPRSARLVFEHAILLTQLDRLDEAGPQWQKVAELAPGSDVAYIAAAQKNLFDGNVQDAVRLAREGLDKGHHHFMLLALYGDAVLQFGAEPGDPQFADARAALEQAVAVGPSYASAQLALGKLYLLEGRLDEAIARLDAARAVAPRNPAVYSNLAAAFRRKGDAQRADEMLAILARLNQEQAERIRNAPGDRKASHAARPPL